MSEIRIHLGAPIKVHGEEVAELVLREPNTGDAIAVGKMPYVLDEGGRVKPLPDVAAMYLSRMAAVPPSSIEQLHLADFNNAAWIVADFFWKPAVAKSTS